MKLIRPLFIITVVFVAAGCAANPRIEDLTSAQRAQVGKIEIYADASDQKYEMLGTVTGLSCNRAKYQAQDVTEHEALQGVRLNAAKLGADAVFNTLCQMNPDVDWRNNCWESVKCVGDAVRF